MEHLNIDIETKSSIDISKAGAYKYALSEDFQILLFAYKLNDDPIKIVDLANGETIPAYIVKKLIDVNVIKHAYNAAFEWYCLNRAGYITPINEWQCTMVHGLYLGYPAGLSAIGKALGLPEDKQKLATGKALIKYFCTPTKPTKANGGRTWNLPKHDLAKWNLFKEYCMQDVAAEKEIYDRLKFFQMPEEEWYQWRIDTFMNARGARVDLRLIDGALKVDEDCKKKLTDEAINLSGVANPNSNSQLINWLNDNDIDTDNLRKDTVSELLKSTKEGSVKRVLEIRQQLSKTSIKKYESMKTAVCSDERVRGLTQFYGANRTGRFAGRLVQIQNLPRNYIKTLDIARNLTIRKNTEGLELIYGNIPDTLSQLIRTAFIPSEGRKIVVADFSAIEARVIAWIAGETWVNEVFATHGKIYEATASQMFHVPIERIVKGNPEYELRQKGKVATLALGYQGGANALIAMGALDMGIKEEELPEIVNRWREANKRIVEFWYALGNTAINVMNTARPQGLKGLILNVESDLIYGQSFFTIQLPSSRKLYYPKAFLCENQFGKPALHYYSVNQQSKKWEINSTYGGKLAENVVQAIARDCLTETIKRLYNMNYELMFHVHDEVVIDAPDYANVDDVCKIMSEPIDWAKGLILKAAGFESEYYMKD